MSTSRYNVGQVITIRDGEACLASARERFNVHRMIKQAVEKIPPVVRRNAVGVVLATAAVAGGIAASTAVVHQLPMATDSTSVETEEMSSDHYDAVFGQPGMHRMATKLGLIGGGEVTDPVVPLISFNERFAIEAAAALHRGQYDDVLPLASLAITQGDVADPALRTLLVSMTSEAADHYHKNGNPDEQLQAAKLISDLQQAGLENSALQSIKNNLVEEFIASATPDQLVEFVDDANRGNLQVLGNTADTVLMALLADGHERAALRALSSDWVLKNAPYAVNQAIETIIETGSPEGIERILHLEGRVKLSPELVELGIERLIERGESQHLVYAVAAVIHNDLLNKTIDFDRVFDVVAQSEHYVDQMDFAHVAFRYLNADQLQAIEERVLDEGRPKEIVAWVNRIEGADHTAAFHALAKKTQVMPSADAADTFKSFSEAVQYMRNRTQVTTQEAGIEHGDDPLAHKGPGVTHKPIRM
ncbi:hypothetical protein [Marinobacterium sp. BA1]|uniref:hypothetical protein n=1 Tax=Marinobacterium sp. BA1 TaxID=3138931 RepID=UPI0032E5EC82